MSYPCIQCGSSCGGAKPPENRTCSLYCLENYCHDLAIAALNRIAAHGDEDARQTLKRIAEVE
jgi:hypothetical protein